MSNIDAKRDIFAYAITHANRAARLLEMASSATISIAPREDCARDALVELTKAKAWLTDPRLKAPEAEPEEA